MSPAFCARDQGSKLFWLHPTGRLTKILGHALMAVRHLLVVVGGLGTLALRLKELGQLVQRDACIGPLQ